jgi:hypothetical protein
MLAQEPEKKTEETPPAETKPAETPPRDTNVYIPYTKLKALFEKEGRGVFIPYEKSQELLKAAQAAAAKLPEIKPPVSALINKIESEATVGKDVLRVKAVLSVELLAEGWHRVPLRLGDCAISSATIQKETARLLSGEQGYEILLEKTGKAAETLELHLEYTKPITKTPGNNSVSLLAPQAAVNHWKIRIDEPGIKVSVQPQVATDAPQENKEGPPAKETLVEAHVGAAAEVRINWAPKAEGAAGLAALVAAQTRQEVIVEEGVVRSRTVLAYEITRSELKQLQLEVPSEKEYKVVNVFDANVKKWEVVKKDATSQTILVELDQPARGQQALLVELENVSKDLVKDGVKIPSVKALDAVRQFGILAVRVTPALRAEVLEHGGLSQLDRAELPPEIAKQPWTFAHRFASVPYSMHITLEAVQPRLEATEFVEVYLEPRQLAVDYLASLVIEKAGIFSVDVTIPTGFEVQAVTGRAYGDVQAAVIDSKQVDATDKTKLTVNFARKALGKTAFMVRLVKQLNEPSLLTPAGNVKLPPLPLPRLSHAALERAEGHALFYVPESLRLEPTELTGLRAVATSEALQTSLSVRDGRFPALRETLAFAFHREAASVVLEAERRKPQVSVRQLLTAMIESGVVKYQAQLQYQIQYSGVKTLRLDVPATLADKLHIDTTTIEKSIIQPVPADVPAGYVAWELRGEGELLGEQNIQLSWQEPLSDLEVGKTKAIAIPRIIPQSDIRTGIKLERAWGQIAIGKAETIDITIEGTPPGLRGIDPQIDFLQQAAFPNAARAYEFHEAWSLTVNATRYELEEVKRTSIDRGYVRVVATRAGQLSVQAIYRIRSARQRIAIALPASADPKTAFDTQPLHMNGKATPLEKDGTQYYAPFTNHSAETPVLLELRFTMPGDATSIELPTFPEEPAVQKVYLSVFLPRERTVLGKEGPWSDEMAWQPPPLLQALGVMPEFTTAVNDPGLLTWVTEGVSLAGQPAERLSVDGYPRIFSTLQPESAAAGALQLTVWKRYTLNVLVFGVVILLGVLFMFRPIIDRLAAVGALFAMVFLAAVFQPTLAGALLEGPLVAATVLVLVLWCVHYAVWFLLRAQRDYFAAAPVTGETAATVEPLPLSSTVAPVSSSLDTAPNAASSNEPPGSTNAPGGTN